jgi:uncharacterized protein (DUF2141 family)
MTKRWAENFIKLLSSNGIVARNLDREPVTRVSEEMTIEQQSQCSRVIPRIVQPPVTLRIAAFLTFSVLVLSALPQRDPRGHYSAPLPGQPLCMLRIQVTGFRDNNGTAGGVLFSSPAGWPEDKSKAAVQGGFPIADNQAVEVFQVPPGRYGVVVIHDENSNMKLDRNFFGIPKEGFGFANNPRVVLSAPSFQAGSVAVKFPTTEIAIRLIYK